MLINNGSTRLIYAIIIFTQQTNLNIMKNLLKKKVSLIFLIAMTTGLFSCSEEEADNAIESSDVSTSELKYSYKDSEYERDTFEKDFGDILLNSDQVYNLDTNVISIFSSVEEADTYVDTFLNVNLTSENTKLETLKSANKSISPICGDPLYTFGVRLYDNIDFSGRSIKFFRKNLDVNETDGKGTFIELPEFWKNRVSSLRARGFKFASFVIDEECREATPSITIFENDDPSDPSRRFGAPILDFTDGKPVLKLSNLEEQEFNDIMDSFNVYY